MLTFLQAENKDLDERSDMALGFQKETELECEKAQEKSRVRKEKITDLEKELGTANSQIQILLDDLNKMKADLQLKDAEIRQAMERLDGVNQKAPMNGENQNVERQDEIRRKDMKIKGLLEENDILMTKCRETREQCENIASTLDIVFGVVKKVLNLDPRTQIRAPLQSITAMIQGVLNLGNEGGGAKRVNEESVETRQARRIRMEDAIEVDE
jgi:outer membrane murein-binding lipoprotein Lpp